MDGKDRTLDDIPIERFWRTLKYEHIYLNRVEEGVGLVRGIKVYRVAYVAYYQQKEFIC